jgi:hypothetical protein
MEKIINIIALAKIIASAVFNQRRGLRSGSAHESRSVGLYRCASLKG